VRLVCFDCGAYVSFGSLIECWCVVRLASQLHFNQLISNNKVSIKIIYYSPISMDFHYSFTPALVLLGILYLINAYTSDGQHKEL
jgi:hypothetical protein